MKAKVNMSQQCGKVDMDFVLKNEGVYSVPGCNDRIATLSMNNESFCSIYVFEAGDIEALDIGFFKSEDRFEPLDELVSITFEAY